MARCNGSDGRVAASYPADPGSNPAVSGSYEIDLKIQSIFPNNEAVAQMFVWLTFS